MIKAGFAGEDNPRCVFPSVIGRGNEAFTKKIGVTSEPLLGNEAFANRANLQLSNPIKNGEVENWEDMEKLLQYAIYNELRTDPSECTGVVLTESSGTSKANREKIASILFDTF